MLRLLKQIYLKSISSKLDTKLEWIICSGLTSIPDTPSSKVKISSTTTKQVVYWVVFGFCDALFITGLAITSTIISCISQIKPKPY